MWYIFVVVVFHCVGSKARPHNDTCSFSANTRTCAVYCWIRFVYFMFSFFFLCVHFPFSHLRVCCVCAVCLQPFNILHSACVLTSVDVCYTFRPRLVYLCACVAFGVSIACTYTTCMHNTYDSTFSPNARNGLYLMQTFITLTGFVCACDFKCECSCFFKLSEMPKTFGKQFSSMMHDNEEPKRRSLGEIKRAAMRMRLCVLQLETTVRACAPNRISRWQRHLIFAPNSLHCKFGHGLFAPFHWPFYFPSICSNQKLFHTRIADKSFLVCSAMAWVWRLCHLLCLHCYVRPKRKCEREWFFGTWHVVKRTGPSDSAHMKPTSTTVGAFSRFPIVRQRKKKWVFLLGCAFKPFMHEAH